MQPDIIPMTYYVIYDGNCNLCVSLVNGLEALDQGAQFRYAPMQDEALLARFGISTADCAAGMMLINASQPDQRWQGSDAAEEIGHLLPAGQLFVEAYRSLPGMKWAGDRLYEQVRDNRYTLFGQRSSLYESVYPIDPIDQSCQTDACAGDGATSAEPAEH